MNRLSLFLYLLVFLYLCCGKSAGAADPAELLPVEQAFQLTAEAKQADRLLLSWKIANGYHLYRKSFKFVSLTPGIVVGKSVLPAGKMQQDPIFGEAETYQDHVEVEIPVRREEANSNELVLEITVQGCADVGVCYMPDRQKVSLILPDKGFDWWGLSAATARFTSLISEQEGIAATFKGNPVWLVMASFFGFGLLLAFTPCVFPMIPILSGVIVGQGPGITTFRAFSLSLSYVLASAATYTLFGVLAGLFGNNLQVFFQKPAVLIGFSGFFIVLALSMFGFFRLQMPAFLQNRLMAFSGKQRGGNLGGAAIMGALSALAVGPCVTAPLAGALIYIGQTGDALLGGIALFCLGLGMGAPLLVVGASAGRLLPKAGSWLNFTKALFGMGLLAVAVYLLGRVIPLALSLALWGALLFSPLFYLSWKRFWRSVLALALTYALVLVIGVFTHRQRDALQLLCVAAVACEKPASLPFKTISSSAELTQILAAAHDKKQWVMLDVYADWCVACQEMEHYTFTDDKVRSALAKAVLVRADVTQNTPDDQALLKRFGLIGPPAVLFFNPDQQEQTSLRVIGFMDSETFLVRLGQVFK